MFEIVRALGLNQATIMETFQIGALAFTRLLVAITLVPFFGGKIVKQRVKMGIATALFLVVAPAAFPTDGDPIRLTGGIFTILLMKEAIVGFVIGFLVALLFHAVEAAGRFVDFTRGASMAQIMAPQVGSQVSLFGQIYLQMTIVIFLAIGGHHAFLRGLARSYELIPVTELPVLAGGGSVLGDFLIHSTSNLFGIALQLAAPAAVATFVTDVFLGIANKVAPQIQVFFLGMPLKAMVGILMIFLVLGLLKTEIIRSAGGALDDMSNGIRLLTMRDG